MEQKQHLTPLPGTFIESEVRIVYNCKSLIAHVYAYIYENQSYYELIITIFFCYYRYYSDLWLQEVQQRLPPHMDEEVLVERNKCMKRLFNDIRERENVAREFAKFASKGPFSNVDSIQSSKEE